MSALSPKQLRLLLQKLHTRNIVGWLEEERLGKPVYDAIYSQIEAGGLSTHQIANGLVVLVRLRLYGDHETLFSLILTATAHETTRVRDQAVSLAIGLMRSHRWEPPYLSDETIQVLRRSVHVGVSPDVARLVELLTQKGPAALEFK